MKDILEEELQIHQKPIPIPEPEPYIEITADQADEIRHTCRNYPDMLQDMLNRLQLPALERMPRAEYRKNIERLRKVVTIREEASRPKILD